MISVAQTFTAVTITVLHHQATGPVLEGTNSNGATVLPTQQQYIYVCCMLPLVLPQRLCDGAARAKELSCGNYINYDSYLQIARGVHHTTLTPLLKQQSSLLASYKPRVTAKVAEQECRKCTP